MWTVISRDPLFTKDRDPRVRVAKSDGGHTITYIIITVAARLVRKAITDGKAVT